MQLNGSLYTRTDDKVILYRQLLNHLAALEAITQDEPNSDSIETFLPEVLEKLLKLVNRMKQRPAKSQLKYLSFISLYWDYRDVHLGVCFGLSAVVASILSALGFISHICMIVVLELAEDQIYVPTKIPSVKYFRDLVYYVVFTRPAWDKRPVKDDYYEKSISSEEELVQTPVVKQRKSSGDLRQVPRKAEALSTSNSVTQFGSQSARSKQKHGRKSAGPAVKQQKEAQKPALQPIYASLPVTPGDENTRAEVSLFEDSGHSSESDLNLSDSELLLATALSNSRAKGLAGVHQRVPPVVSERPAPIVPAKRPTAEPEKTRQEYQPRIGGAATAQGNVHQQHYLPTTHPRYNNPPVARPPTANQLHSSGTSSGATVTSPGVEVPAVQAAPKEIPGTIVNRAISFTDALALHGNSGRSSTPPPSDPVLPRDEDEYPKSKNQVPPGLALPLQAFEQPKVEAAQQARRSKFLPFICYDEQRKEPMILPATLLSAESVGSSSHSSTARNRQVRDYFSGIATPTFSLFSHFSSLPPSIGHSSSEETAALFSMPVSMGTTPSMTSLTGSNASSMMSSSSVSSNESIGDHEEEDHFSKIDKDRTLSDSHSEQEQESFIMGKNEPRDDDNEDKDDDDVLAYSGNWHHSKRHFSTSDTLYY